MRKRYDKLYRSLTASERTQAFVHALAREDDEEVDHLHRTCPRYRYEAEDANYVRQRLGMYFLWSLASGEESRAAQVAVLGALTLVGHTAGEGDGDAAEQLMSCALAKFRAVRVAFDLFCAELGYASTSVHAAYRKYEEPIVVFAEKLDRFYGDDDPDVAEVTEMLDKFRRTWEVVT